MTFGSSTRFEEIPHYREQQGFAQDTINFAHDNLIRRSPIQIPLAINSQLAPLEARELAGGLIRAAQRSMGPNLEALQNANTPEQFGNLAREFRREIGLELDRTTQVGRIDEQSRPQIIESLSNWYLQQLQESATRAVQNSYQMPLGERIIGRNSSLNLGLGVSLMEEQFGNRNAQRDFLFRVAQRLDNSEQVQDMLIAAQRSGFSSNAIFEVGRNFDLVERPSSEGQSFLVSQMIQNALRYTATLMNQNQRRELDRENAQTERGKFESENNRQEEIGQAEKILRSTLGVAYLQRVLRAIENGEDPTTIIVDRVESLANRNSLERLVPTRLQ